jgi:hypothetical protein
LPGTYALTNSTPIAFSPTGVQLGHVVGTDGNVAVVLVLPTPTPGPCAGDCSGDAQVTVDEILVMVNIALGNSPVSDCNPGDLDRNGQVTVDEVLTAVDRALNGCGS